MITQTTAKEWIYLSPHLDDAALSCGGLISHQTAAGTKVTIITICAGDAPVEEFSDFARGIHARWDLNSNPPARRRIEDQLACQRLGADFIHLSLPDSIYRRAGNDNHPLYTSEEAIFGPLDPAEGKLISWVADEIRARLTRDSYLVCPMTLGGHVDHRLVRAAAEQLDAETWYYADYPYVLEDQGWKKTGIPTLVPTEWATDSQELDEDSLNTWGDSVAAFISQVPIFWPDDSAMRGAIRKYYQQSDSARLWRQRNQKT